MLGKLVNRRVLARQTMQDRRAGATPLRGLYALLVLHGKLGPMKKRKIRKKHRVSVQARLQALTPQRTSDGVTGNRTRRSPPALPWPIGVPVSAAPLDSGDCQCSCASSRAVFSRSPSGDIGGRDKVSLWSWGAEKKITIDPFVPLQLRLNLGYGRMGER